MGSSTSSQMMRGVKLSKLPRQRMMLAPSQIVSTRFQIATTLEEVEEGYDDPEREGGGEKVTVQLRPFLVPSFSSSPSSPVNPIRRGVGGFL